MTSTDLSSYDFANQPSSLGAIPTNRVPFVSAPQLPVDKQTQGVAQTIFDTEPPTAHPEVLAKKSVTQDDPAQDLAQATRQITNPERDRIVEVAQRVDHADTEGVKKTITDVWGFNLVADSFSDAGIPTQPIGQRFIVGEDHKVEVLSEAKLTIVDMVPPEKKDEVIAAVKEQIGQDPSLDEQTRQAVLQGDVVTLGPAETDDMEQLAFDEADSLYDVDAQGPSSALPSAVGPGPSPEPPSVPVQAEMPPEPTLLSQVPTPVRAEESVVEEAAMHDARVRYTPEVRKVFESFVAMKQDELVEKTKSASPQQRVEDIFTEKAWIDEAAETFGLEIKSRFDWITIGGRSFASLPKTDLWDALEHVEDPEATYAMLERSLNPKNTVHQSLLRATKKKNIRMHSKDEIAQTQQEAKRKVKEAMREFYLFIEQRRVKNEEEKRIRQEQAQEAKPVHVEQSPLDRKKRIDGMVATTVSERYRRLEARNTARKMRRELWEAKRQRAVEKNEKFTRYLRTEQMRQITTSRQIRHESEKSDEVKKAG